MMKKFDDFKNDLGFRESGNKYTCENTMGYLGKYQFGKARLYDLGFSINGWAPKGLAPKKIITVEQFLNDPLLQEELFRKHVKTFSQYALKKFGEYINNEVSGIKVTLSGLIAGAHLLGWGGVKKFLTEGIDGKDGFGTKISEYIKKFADYNLE
jgi:hypothetical protein